MRLAFRVLFMGIACFTLAACSGINGWSSDDTDGQNLQTDSTGNGPHQRMKITRGSGYGDEVPYESKYNPS